MTSWLWHRIPLNSSNLLRKKFLYDLDAPICKHWRCDGRAIVLVTKVWLSSGHPLSNPPQIDPGFRMRESKSPKSANVKISERSYLEEVLLDQKDEGLKTTAQKTAASVVAIGSIGYMFIQAFWAQDSPQQLYSNSLKLIRADNRCTEIFGASMAAFGEDNGRGRRRNISNKRYVTRDGEERLRIVFHLKGNRKTGRVTAEIAKHDGAWDYRFLLVETDELVSETIILIDNRH